MTAAPPIRPIRDPATHAAALAEIRTLWGAPPGTEAGERLDVLLVLVDAYETATQPIEPPHPIEATRTRMEGAPPTADRR